MPHLIERQLRMGYMVTALIIGNKAFAPACDPFYRPPQTSSRPGDDGLLGIMLSLIAKAAADVGSDDTNGAFRDAELFRYKAADVMGHLRRAIERQPSIRGICNGEDRAWFDSRADQSIVDEIDARHMLRCGKRLSDGGFVPACPAKADVLRGAIMQLRRCRRAGFARFDDDRQALVVDFDKFGRVERLFTGLRDQRGNRLADVAYAITGKRPARRFRHCAAVAGADGPERTHRADAVRSHIDAAENGDYAGRIARA